MAQHTPIFRQIHISFTLILPLSSQKPRLSTILLPSCLQYLNQRLLPLLNATLHPASPISLPRTFPTTGTTPPIRCHVLLWTLNFLWDASGYLWSLDFVWGLLLGCWVGDRVVGVEALVIGGCGEVFRGWGVKLLRNGLQQACFLFQFQMVLRGLLLSLECQLGHHGLDAIDCRGHGRRCYVFNWTLRWLHSWHLRFHFPQYLLILLFIVTIIDYDLLRWIRLDFGSLWLAILLWVLVAFLKDLSIGNLDVADHVDGLVLFAKWRRLLLLLSRYLSWEKGEDWEHGVDCCSFSNLLWVSLIDVLVVIGELGGWTEGFVRNCWDVEVVLHASLGVCELATPYELNHVVLAHVNASALILCQFLLLLSKSLRIALLILFVFVNTGRVFTLTHLVVLEENRPVAIVVVLGAHRVSLI